VGYALDGSGIYGREERGTGGILHDPDPNARHGTNGPVMWDGTLVDMYHYVPAPEYPHTIGCFRGTAVRADFRPGRVRQTERAAAVAAIGR